MDGSIPGGWHGVDLGGATPAGSQVEDAGTWTITGGGADVWNSSDSFHFVSSRISGDAQLTARVVSLSNTDAWTKAGVMIRESTTADARHAFTCVTAANGIAFQRRLSPGGASSHTSGPLRSAPT